MMIREHHSSTVQIILLQILLAAMIIGTLLAFLIVAFVTPEADVPSSTTSSFNFNQINNVNLVGLHAVRILVL
jgi:hypothetical protein